jgi:MFS family permease
MPTETQAISTVPAHPPDTRFGPNHRWIVLGIGVASQASFAAAFSGIAVTGPTLRSGYHLSTALLGVVLGAIALGIALSEVLWGIWTDRFGERRILLTGLLSTGTVLALLAAFVVPTSSWVPSVWLLVAGMLLVGVLGGSVNGSSGRAVMAWFHDGSRGFAMSIRQTAIPAGGGIGAALLPWLAVSWGFRAVFGVLAVFCFASAVATWLWLHEPPRDSAAVTSAATGQDRSPLARWDVWRLALASGLLTVPQFAVLTFAAVFLNDAKHAGLVAGSLTILAVQVGGATARVWSGRWTDRRANRRPYVRGVGVITAVAFGGAAVLVHAPTIVVAIALVVGGLLASAWHGVAYTEIASMAGADRAGTALGLENTTVFAAAFLTPVLIPVLLGVTSWPVVWLAAGICSLLAVPLAPRAIRPALAG